MQVYNERKAIIVDRNTLIEHTRVCQSSHSMETLNLTVLYTLNTGSSVEQNIHLVYIAMSMHH